MELSINEEIIVFASTGWENNFYQVSKKLRLKENNKLNSEDSKQDWEN